MIIAQEQGHFAAELTPVEIKTKKGVQVLDKDEHARPGVTIEQLAKLPPVFKKNGLVSAGNASVRNICSI